MALTDSNSLTKNYHGKFGHGVYRTLGDFTILQKLPDFSHVRWSKAQRAVRKRFVGATGYAKASMADPERRRFYEKKARHMQSAWNMAISDYMLNPEIGKIDLSEYHGKKGDIINVEAHDRYSVAAVLVFIYNALGQEVESGLAVSLPWEHIWIYEAREDNRLWQGGKIVIRVCDSPGNVVTASLAV